MTKRKPLSEFNCSWARAADAVGDKWSIMIIRDAFFGVRTFSAFASNTGIARNILSQRLDHLISHGIMQKRPLGVGSSRFEYSLTEKGRGLFPVIAALGQWGDEWIFGEGKEPFVVVDKKNRKPVKKMRVESSTRRELQADDITFAAGPGANKVTRETVAAIERNESGKG